MIKLQEGFSLSNLGLRAALFEATQDIHRALDARVALISAPATFGGASGYGVYLGSTWAFRRSVEEVMARMQARDAALGWSAQMILPEIDLDLCDLSLPAPVELHRLLEVETDRSSFAGVLYVIEGSSLGARVLSRRAASLGFGPAYGARHLARQVAEPGRWQRFLGWLESGDFDRDLAVSAAIKTFQLAQECHGGPSPSRTQVPSFPSTP